MCWQHAKKQPWQKASLYVHCICGSGVVANRIGQGEGDCSPVSLRWSSWKYNFVEVSEHNLEISQTWSFYLRFCLSKRCYSWTNLTFLHWLIFCVGFLLGFPLFDAFLIVISMGKSRLKNYLPQQFFCMKKLKIHKVYIDLFKSI